MPQIVEPTKQTLAAAQQINCQMPLNSIENCGYQYCMQNSNNCKKQDLYWMEFLEAQQNSGANYIYKINNSFGSNEDATLKKMEPLKPEAINQLVLQMSFTAGLLKTEIFYLLSFLLHLVKLTNDNQKQVVEYMLLQRKLLDEQIINYLQIIAQHNATGLTGQQLKDCQAVFEHVLAQQTTTDSLTCYNPQHIFLKPLNFINPYELEYLNNLLHSEKKFTAQQTLYMVKFVFKLQQLPDASREDYLRYLREHNIMPFNKFEYLVEYLVNRAKRLDQNKLKSLLTELHILMGNNPCMPYAQPAIATKKTKTSVVSFKAITIDFFRIDKALDHLMHATIPNIVRLNDLKSFLQDMLTLTEQQIVSVFNHLKLLKIMTAEHFNYLERFINAGKLGKLDQIKQKEFLQLLRKLAAAPVNQEVMVKLDIPAIKGPIKEKFDNKEATMEVSNTKAETADLEQQKAEESKQENNASKKSENSVKTVKRKVTKKTKGKQNRKRK